MFNVNIDLSALKDLANLEEVQRIGNQAAANLALLTHAKVEELAAQKLHSRLEMFRKAVSFKQEDSGVFLIHLDASADWINDGYPAHSMIPDLVNSPKAHIANDGHKYMIVPFTMTAGKSGPTQVTPAQNELVESVKKQLKEAKIPWAKIEKDDQGRPKLGQLHKLNLSTVLKNREARPGHGRDSLGYGAVGGPRVGMTGIPFMSGAGIYQSLSSTCKVERSVMTFRVASEKQMSPLWDHPGLEPTCIFEEAYEWALRELQDNVMPSITKEISELSK